MFCAARKILSGFFHAGYAIGRKERSDGIAIATVRSIASMTIYNTLITGSEKQARQGERGFDRRERTQKYVTKAKRKFNTVLRSLYEAARRS